MLRHEHFEELSALAALGQISESELTELNAHIVECDSCRAAQDEYSQVLHKVLPLADPRAAARPKLPLSWFGKKAGYKRRFLARARAEGFQFSEEVEQRKLLLDRLSFSFLRPSFASVLVVLVLVATGILAHRWRESTIARQSAVATELRRQISELSKARDLLQVKLTDEVRANASLESKLSKSQGARLGALARAKELEQQLQDAINKAKSLRDDLEQAGARAGDQESRLQEEARSLAELSSEIKKLRADRAGDTATMVAQESRLRELSEELDAKTEMLDREHQLLAAGRDIRDLMGARNLHIVDVFDVDGSGEDRRAFGRVFYTEGQSLIFYAFDLPSRKRVNGKHSFQAWGDREGTTVAAKSLGIFYMDDQAQKRWVLKVEEPELLSQIDAVFVTVEPFGGAKAPTGKALLYAYLGNKANHP